MRTDRELPRLAAALRTLESLGYAYHGGEQWKPPLGKQPAQPQLVATITISQRGPVHTIDNHFEDCVRTWPNGEYKLYTSPPPQRKPLTDEQPQRWAVFCGSCRKEWSVPYQHPGKSVCDDCVAAHSIKENT